MGLFRLKHSFTAGELSPLMFDRTDFDRFKNGCKKLFNAVCTTQGPAVRRPGFKFIYDLTTLGLDIADPRVRMIPFIFNELQAYTLIFFVHTDGDPRVVFATTDQDGNDGLVTGTGVSHDVEDTQTQIFTGAATYTYPRIEGATVNSNTVTHIALDGTRSTLTETTDYTITYTPTEAEVVVTWAVETTGTLELTLDVSTVPIPIGEVVELVLPTTWDVDLFDWAQSADEMYIAQSVLNPHIIQRYYSDLWLLRSKTFTSQPEEWSDVNGWPERVTFHQQRLAFAANKLRRQTVWMTQAGDFDSFFVDTAQSPLLASDAITFTLDSGTQNKIQWITSGKSLHAGTLGNEWTVQGNDQSALTPSNILAQRQTNNGSEPNKPLLVGLTTLFVERHGRTVNEFVYDYTFDSYKTSDMAILSPHVTEQYSITDWTYQQTPDSVIWCVREDGDLLGITYQRQHKVVGWHHHDTQGEFKAITAIPGNTREDDVWSVVRREIDGVDKYYVEKLEDWFHADSAEWGRFLDSHLVYQGAAVESVSGLGHLEGCSVDILGDGAVHPPRTVESGVIQLNGEYSHVVVGLPYVTEIRPNLVDLNTQQGTSFGRRQRIINLIIDFYRSLGAYVGKVSEEDGEREEELPFRTPNDATGQQVPLFTGWYEYGFMEGHDRQSEYFIRQKQPLPLTVRSVVDEVEVYD